MSPAMHSPGPRDGLDEGSLAELAQGSREIEVGLSTPFQRNAGEASTDQAHAERGCGPSAASTPGPIDVPEHAPALIDGLAAYGACS